MNVINISKDSIESLRNVLKYPTSCEELKQVVRDELLIRCAISLTKLEKREKRKKSTSTRLRKYL